MKKKITRVQYQNQKRKKKLRFRKWVIVVFFLFFLIILLYSTSNIFNWFHDNNKITQSEDDFKNVKIKYKKDTSNTQTITNGPLDDDYFNYIKYSLLEVDFKSLKAKNSDTVAWIQVKGTNINYPVVQTKDNSYYLNHAFDKSTNQAGWVFMDYRNNVNELDQNTIIYAHSRYNGTMFGSLKNILTSKWYQNKENHIIRLSTEQENSLWQVFSVYTIYKESYYITINFNTKEEQNTFLTTLKTRTQQEFSATPVVNDKILTLSTCKDNFGNRVVMHAKLIKIEQRD